MLGTILGTFLAILLLGVLSGLTWFYWVVLGINHPSVFFLALATLLAILSVIPAALIGDS